LTPPLQFFSRQGMHRLIPSRFSEQGSVLAAVAKDDAMLADLMLLDGVTNDRLQGEQGSLGGISPYELVYGIAQAHIINGAFTHTCRDGSRFNDATRGAWYCALTLETATVEVAFHKARHLAEMVVPGQPGERPAGDTTIYDDWLADFSAEFHVLEPAEAYAEYLLPGPLPECYVPSQAFARDLLLQRSNGVSYPSVRDEGGGCAVCFRPALVHHVRRGVRMELVLRRSQSFALHAKQSPASGYEHTARIISG
jgi:RES domain-containing protein